MDTSLWLHRKRICQNHRGVATDGCFCSPQRFCFITQTGGEVVVVSHEAHLRLAARCYHHSPTHHLRSSTDQIASNVPCATARDAFLKLSKKNCTRPFLQVVCLLPASVPPPPAKHVLRPHPQAIPRLSVRCCFRGRRAACKARPRNGQRKNRSVHMHEHTTVPEPSQSHPSAAPLRPPIEAPCSRLRRLL